MSTENNKQKAQKNKKKGRTDSLKIKIEGKTHEIEKAQIDCEQKLIELRGAKKKLQDELKSLEPVKRTKKSESF